MKSKAYNLRGAEGLLKVAIIHSNHIPDACPRCNSERLAGSKTILNCLTCDFLWDWRPEERSKPEIRLGPF